MAYNDFYNANNYMQNNNMQNYPTFTQNAYGYNNSYQNQQNLQSYTNTNKIYVSGIDEVKTKFLPPNSDVIFIDNYKDIIYEKIVDSTGKHEIKTFSISEYKSNTEQTNNSNNIDLSQYAKKSDVDNIMNSLNQYNNTINDMQNEIKKLNNKIINFNENQNKKSKGD